MDESTNQREAPESEILKHRKRICIKKQILTEKTLETNFMVVTEKVVWDDGGAEIDMVGNPHDKLAILCCFVFLFPVSYFVH
ncbi:hypothetical protein L1887_28112 [Cichorium endivia]|nr:hypothetical protein L1887_28112 [Cichorium endivia]